MNARKARIKTIIKLSGLIALVVLYCYFLFVLLPLMLTGGTLTSMLGLALLALGVIIPAAILWDRGLDKTEGTIPTEDVPK